MEEKFTVIKQVSEFIWRQLKWELAYDDDDVKSLDNQLEFY